MPNVNFVRPELVKMGRAYMLIADALEGEQQVKHRAGFYLPPPQPLNTQEGRDRYHAYKTRAVFYNVTKRTQQGLLGQLFSRAPEVSVPGYLKSTVSNMDGIGVNATQQCKGTAGEVIAFGRSGLLADFPTLPNGKEATREDLNLGRVASRLTHYKAHQIINWRYQRDYLAKKLTLVILEEKREIYSDKNTYSFTYGKQWRVCRLDEGGFYVQELYFQSNVAPVATYYPTDYDGNRLDYIPFEFIGAEDNDPDIDDAPMYSLASLNIAHYRNSADFEDSAFYIGQPTTIITGLSQAWVDQNMKGGITLGSRIAIPLPTGADIKIEQADPNTLAAAGMEHKEKQMVALGAKLVEQRKIQRTATEANQEEAAETSVLQTVADNVSVAYANAFASAGRFLSGNADGVTFKINTAFEIQAMDATTRAETIKEWQQSAISFSEMRQVLRRAGVATLGDDEAKAAIAEDDAMRAAQAAALNPPNVQDPAGDTGATA